MDKKKDALEKFIKEELQKEADNICQEIQEEALPPEVRERMKQNLEQKIDEYEKERLYSSLSEEDREALRLGREMLRKESGGHSRGVVVRKKRRLRVSFALAAVLVLVIAVGANSFGVLDRAIKIGQVMVGQREVVQIDSSEKTKTIVEENEEKAYQLIKDEFGTDPVRIVARPEGMSFQKMKYDRESQIGEFYYSYNDEQLLYVISTSYRDSSWGVDVEDNMGNTYQKEVRGCSIQVKEYETPESKTHRYTAKFKHKNMEYLMIGTMEQAEFDNILENLHFFS